MNILDSKIIIRDGQDVLRSELETRDFPVLIKNTGKNIDGIVTHGLYNRLILQKNNQILTMSNHYGSEIKWADLDFASITSIERGKSVIIRIQILSVDFNSITKGIYYIHSEILNPDKNYWKYSDMQKIRERYPNVLTNRIIKSPYYKIKII